MSKRITNEMYISELKEKNPDIIPVENYIKANIPIMHHCLKHDIFWKISPSNALQGKGCSNCRSEKIRKKFLKTNEQYKKELAERNPNLEVLEDYIDSNTPILHRCIKHDVKWKVVPCNAIRGCGCYKCKSEKIADFNYKTDKEYREELSKSNPHITAEETYVGAKVPIIHHCIIHNVYYKTAPCNAIKAYGCPQCASEHFKKITSLSEFEYKKRLSDNNPNVELAGNYTNMNTHALFHCLIHDEYWNTLPESPLKGRGCPKCRSDKMRESNGFSTEEYNQMLRDNNPKVIAVDNYTNMNTPMMFKCLIHDIEWKSLPSTPLNGGICPECKMDIKHKKYVADLKVKNPTTKLISKYKGADIPIPHQCLKHNIIWNISPTNALKGHECEYCRREKIGDFSRKSNNQYINDVKRIDKNIEVVDQYVNCTTPITHHCIKHNEFWEASPRMVLAGHCGCKKCHSEKISSTLSKSPKEYIDEVAEINPFILIEENYINSHTSILHRCLLDNYRWYAKPNNILSGRGCPKCNQSKGERKISTWLYQNSISYKYQHIFEHCKDKKPLPFDFYLPYYNIVIEFDGEQHFRSIDFFGGEEKFQLQQKHDKIKDEFCKNNGITLLRIPYFDYDLIEEILDSFLFN